MWSSPCVSWSAAGFAAGLDSEEGILFLRSLGLLNLIRPLVSVGENVAAIVGHQHFPIIQEVHGVLTGRSLSVRILSLQDWVPMERRRAFIFDGVESAEKVVSGYLPADPRKAVKANISDEIGLRSASVPEEAVEVLKEYELLPSSLKRRLRVGFTRNDVLLARIEYGCLPVVMASYRRQHQLPRRLLAEKGLFTFLVRDEDEEYPRYLDFFEAARFMGFGLQLVLPLDDLHAMHAIGNAVAPIQAVEVLNRVVGKVWPEIAISPQQLRKQIMTMAYGQADLRRFTRQGFGQVQRLTPFGNPQLHLDGKFVIFWGSGCVRVSDFSVFLRHELPLLPFGHAWPIRKFEFVKAGLGGLLHVGFHYGMLSGENFTVKVYPWCTVEELSQLFGPLKGIFLQQIGVRCDQMVAHLTMLKHWQVKGIALQVEDLEIMLIFGTDRRIGKLTVGVPFSDMVDLLFPFGLSAFVEELWDVRNVCAIQVSDLAVPGCFQVFFGLVPFWIFPLGRIDLEPLQTVSVVQQRLVMQFAKGQVSVQLRAAGKRVEEDTTIVLASRFGPLSAALVGDRRVEDFEDGDGLDEWPTELGKPVEVRPHGFLLCSVRTKVGTVQAYLADRFYGGAASVRITCNGRLLEIDDLILDLDALGCLRARIFPLRGGAASGENFAPASTGMQVEEGVTLNALRQTKGVQFSEVHVSPYGFFRCMSHTTIADLQTRLADRYFGGANVVRITCNGRFLPPHRLAHEADREGCLRARAFAMLGGGKSLVVVESLLSDLMQEHGVNVKAVAGKAKELCEKTGHDKVGAILEARDPWFKIKKEATALGMVLIPQSERGKGSKGPDPLQKSDPWS